LPQLLLTGAYGFSNGTVQSWLLYQVLLLLLLLLHGRIHCLQAFQVA
jgi:hypothetical protein